MVGFYQFLNFLFLLVEWSIIYPNIYDNIVRLLIKYGLRWNKRSSVFGPAIKWTFTFQFFNSLASLNHGIPYNSGCFLFPFSSWLIGWFIFRWIWWWIWCNGVLNVVAIVVAIGVVIVVVFVLGGGVATTIVGINFLFFCFVVFNLIIVSGDENLFYFICFWNMFLFKPLSIWKSIILFVVKACVLVIEFDDVEVSDVVGNFGQLFAFCLSIINDLSKTDFSLSSSRRKYTALTRVWMWARCSVTISDTPFWESLLIKSLYRWW